MYRFQENLKIRQLVNPGVIESVVDLAFVLVYIPVLILYNTQLGLVALACVVLYLGTSAFFTPRIISLVQNTSLTRPNDFLNWNSYLASFMV